MSQIIPTLIRRSLRRTAAPAVRPTARRLPRQLLGSAIPRFSGILFPDKLRTKGVINVNALITYATSSTQYSYFDITNPATGCLNNMSGLSWLISGPQTNGTSFAPYSFGNVLNVDVELQVKTTIASAANVGAIHVLFPLGYTSTSTTLIATNAAEAPGASRIIMTPEVPNTTSVSGPQVRKHYNMSSLIGVPEIVVMGIPQSYGFYYNQPNGDSQYLCVVSSTENLATDSTLTSRMNMKLTFDILFSARNVANVNAPHV
jgi:hypothetical protein